MNSPNENMQPISPGKTLTSLAAAALAVLLLGLPAAAAPAKRPPNLVLILIDDMGWMDIAANGSKYYRTPHIDHLASEGVRFTQAYAPAAVCSPSRAAILTGKSPARLHLTDWIPGDEHSGGAPAQRRFTQPEWTLSLPPGETTIAELLKTRGYATAAIGKWHLGGDDKDRNGPLAHGFDINIAGGHTGQPASYFWPYGKPGDTHRVPGLSDAGGKSGEYLTDRLTDEAIRFIDTHKEQPFFLYLPHYAVHGPLGAKPEDIESFRDTPAAGKQNSPLYAAMVKAVDESVGRIDEHLTKLGLSDHTVLVFTSDNGGVTMYPQHTSNAPLRAQKGFPYEGGLRVPLIVKAPGLAKPGLVNDTPVIGTDLFATFAALAGLPNKSLDGIDITPALRGDPLPDRSFIWHYPHYWGGGLITPFSVIRAGNWKLVRWYEFQSTELYNLAEDPSEKTDLAAKDPEKVIALGKQLSAALAAQGAQFPIPRPGAPPAPATNPAHAPRFLAP